MITEPAERRLPAPWWGALVLAYELLAEEHSPATGLCVIRRVTGVPCPSCGSTRALRAFTSEDVVGGFLSNPFMVLVGVLMVGWLVLRVGFAKRIVLSGRSASWLWRLSWVALVANWVYLVIRQ